MTNEVIIICSGENLRAVISRKRSSISNPTAPRPELLSRNQSSAAPTKWIQDGILFRSVSIHDLRNRAERFLVGVKLLRWRHPVEDV
jgi:hypothetical protein